MLPGNFKAGCKTCSYKKPNSDILNNLQISRHSVLRICKLESTSKIFFIYIDLDTTVTKPGR